MLRYKSERHRKGESSVKLLRFMILSDLSRQSPLVENFFIVRHATKNVRRMLLYLEVWSRNGESQLPYLVENSRVVPQSQEPMNEISLHSLGDASGNGVADALYAVVSQPTKTYQVLVASKARLAKEWCTIPRLELVAGHMAVNLAINVETSLQGFPITSVVCLLNSSVALYWILGGRELKQFVGNRVRKIRERYHVKWRHVPTDQNAADVASRGGIVNEENHLWWHGPDWLSDPGK